MDIADFLTQLNKIREKELEQRVWELWLVRYQGALLTGNEVESYEEMLSLAKNQKTEEVQGGLYADQAGFF